MITKRWVARRRACTITTVIMADWSLESGRPPPMILKDFPEGLWKILQDHGNGAVVQGAAPRLGRLTGQESSGG